MLYEVITRTAWRSRSDTVRRRVVDALQRAADEIDATRAETAH